MKPLYLSLCLLPAVLSGGLASNPDPLSGTLPNMGSKTQEAFLLEKWQEAFGAQSILLEGTLGFLKIEGGATQSAKEDPAGISIVGDLSAGEGTWSSDTPILAWLVKKGSSASSDPNVIRARDKGPGNNQGKGNGKGKGRGKGKGSSSNQALLPPSSDEGQDFYYYLADSGVTEGLWSSPNKAGAFSHMSFLVGQSASRLPEPTSPGSGLISPVVPEPSSILLGLTSLTAFTLVFARRGARR